MTRQIQIRPGTATENDAFTGAVGEITMDTTNNTLRVHDGTTPGGTALAKKSEISSQQTLPDNYDFVIESQLPTAENNYTWYRKYKSGWVEQGGICMSSAGTGDITIVFPIEFINNYYTLNISLRLSTRSESTSSKNECNAISLTTTSFTTHIDSNIPGKFWTAFGFASA